MIERDTGCRANDCGWSRGGVLNQFLVSCSRVSIVVRGSRGLAEILYSDPHAKAHPGRYTVNNTHRCSTRRILYATRLYMATWARHGHGRAAAARRAPGPPVPPHTLDGDRRSLASSLSLSTMATLWRQAVRQSRQADETAPGPVDIARPLRAPSARPPGHAPLSRRARARARAALTPAAAPAARARGRSPRRRRSTRARRRPRRPTRAACHRARSAARARTTSGRRPSR